MTTFVAKRSESDAKEFERKFFCEECDSRVDLCSCEEFEDRGCWDCGPDCKINQRRKVVKELKVYMLVVHTIPETRFGKRFETPIYMPS